MTPMEHQEWTILHLHPRDIVTNTVKCDGPVNILLTGKISYNGQRRLIINLEKFEFAFLHVINFLLLVIDIRQEVGKVEASGRIENTMKVIRVGVVTIKVEHQ